MRKFSGPSSISSETERHPGVCCREGADRGAKVGASGKSEALGEPASRMCRDVHSHAATGEIGLVAGQESGGTERGAELGGFPGSRVGRCKIEGGGATGTECRKGRPELDSPRFLEIMAKGERGPASPGLRTGAHHFERRAQRPTPLGQLGNL